MSIPQEILNGLVIALAALLLEILRRMTRHIKAIKSEVKNDHTTNLREEQDKRHAATLERLSELSTDVKLLLQREASTASNVADVASRVSTLDRNFQSHVRDSICATPSQESQP